MAEHEVVTMAEHKKRRRNKEALGEGEPIGALREREESESKMAVAGKLSTNLSKDGGESEIEREPPMWFVWTLEFYLAS
ncbi:hypothetical protein L484_027956 [Morus notabilis]|uniref:Uncharacterized protein n=1 Tax=Morus notabilis TaxID=981085 RepID=W9S7M0_9ROSA|nr:hypothetical protein L484_027956 [Morus notabilis]